MRNKLCVLAMEDSDLKLQMGTRPSPGLGVFWGVSLCQLGDVTRRPWIYFYICHI